jgi:hypothetical protein
MISTLNRWSLRIYNSIHATLTFVERKDSLMQDDKYVKAVDILFSKKLKKYLKLFFICFYIVLMC